MISKMTMFSINDQFNKLVKVTLSEQQALTENSDSKQQEMIDGSAKPPISFRIISHQRGNIQQQEYSQEIFCQISCTLESRRKIFTKKISFLMFIC